MEQSNLTFFFISLCAKQFLSSQRESGNAGTLYYLNQEFKNLFQILPAYALFSIGRFTFSFGVTNDI